MKPSSIGLYAGALIIAGAAAPSPSRANAADERNSPVAAMTQRLDEGFQTSRVRPTNGHDVRDLDSLSTDDVWAVGSQGGGRDSAWARHWDGTRWVPARTPILQYAALNGVSMLTADDAWAVGTWAGGVLTEHWDGRHWRNVEAAQPGGYSNLHAVEAVGPDDVWAVGTTSSPHPHPLIERWDGAAWSQVQESAPQGEGIYSYLDGIKAIAPDDIYAVGYIVDHNVWNPLIEHWDGNTWQLEDLKAPDHSLLFSVDATGPDDVWAVGYDESPQYLGLIAHFDGSAWTTVPTARQSGRAKTLADVVALAPDDAWVVGSDDFGPSGTTSQHWNGHVWTRVDTPSSPFDRDQLVAITAPTPNYILAGGHYVSGAVDRCLTLLWDGSDWTWINRHRRPPG